MGDQEWIYWKCDAKFNNILYKEGKPLVTDNLSFMLGQNSWTAWSHDPAKFHAAMCSQFPIIAQLGSNLLSTCATFNKIINTDSLSSVKFSVNDGPGCQDNEGFFEIVVPLGHNKIITDLQENANSQSKAISDMSKAFHELIGKFAALERQLDGVQEDFSDFKSYMCTGKERECEELLGEIKNGRGEDNDNEL